MPTSTTTRRRSRTGPADGIRVKQSSIIDYTKLPIDNCQIPLLITGGEALEICKQGAEDRKAAIERRRKLRAQILKVVKPPRGVLPKGVKITMEDFKTTSVTVQIEFKVPKEGTSDDEKLKIKKAYGNYVDKHAALTLKMGAWYLSRFSSVCCKASAASGHESGTEFRKRLREVQEPIPDGSSLAHKVLAVENGKCSFDWWVRADSTRIPGRGIPMRTPGVHQAGGRWFLMLPARPEKIPTDIYLPRGTFKRLTMSHYWRLLEAAAVGE